MKTVWQKSLLHQVESILAAIADLPPSPTDAAYQCAFLVDDALSIYVAVNDKMAKQQATLGSLIGNLFGRVPDLPALLKDAEMVDHLWLCVKDYVRMCYKAFEPGLNQDQRAFFVALIPWVEAVKTSTGLMLTRQQALLGKLEGSQLTSQEYLRINDAYNDSVDDYTRLGSVLQPLLDRLFETSTEADA